MKTWKHGIVGILAILAITLTACDDGNGKTKPNENRSDKDPISVSLFNGNTATVSGVSLTDSEWDNVLDELATIINAAYTATEVGIQRNVFGAVFEDGVKIIVRQTLDKGNKYDVKQDQWDTLYLKYAYLIGNADDKSDMLIEAVIYRMGSWEAGYK